MRFAKLFESLLNEYVTAEWTFGFELEGYCKLIEDADNYGKPPKKYFNSILEIKTLLDNIWKKYLPTIEMNITKDDSLHNSFKGEMAFEYKPIGGIQCTPRNIDALIKFFREALNNDGFKLRFDASCGFHIHLKNESVSEQDSYWLFLHYLIDDSFKELLLQYPVQQPGPIQPGDRPIKPTLHKFDADPSYRDGIDKYAKTPADHAIYPDENTMITFPKHAKKILSQLNDLLSNNVDDKQINELIHALIKLREAGTKYNTLNFHESGTIEWRRPREIFEKGKIEPFLKYILTIVRKMSSILEMTSFANYPNVKRDKLFKLMDDTKLPMSMFTSYNSSNKFEPKIPTQSEPKLAKKLGLVYDDSVLSDNTAKIYRSAFLKSIVIDKKLSGLKFKNVEGYYDKEVEKYTFKNGEVSGVLNTNYSVYFRNCHLNGLRMDMPIEEQAPRLFSAKKCVIDLSDSEVKIGTLEESIVSAGKLHVYDEFDMMECAVNTKNVIIDTKGKLFSIYSCLFMVDKNDKERIAFLEEHGMSVKQIDELQKRFKYVKQPFDWNSYLEIDCTNLLKLEKEDLIKQKELLEKGFGII